MSLRCSSLPLSQQGLFLPSNALLYLHHIRHSVIKQEHIRHTCEKDKAIHLDLIPATEQAFPSPRIQTRPLVLRPDLAISILYISTFSWLLMVVQQCSCHNVFAIIVGHFQCQNTE